MTGGSLVIDSVRLGMEAVTSFDRAERSASRIREAVETGLPPALAKACDGRLDGHAHIFIDRLEVASEVAAHWSDDRIAARLAQQISDALSRELDLDKGLLFRDRAEFVGAYAMSIVEPARMDRWWFAEFDGLSVLPRSARLRTLIVNEDEIGFEALSRLSQSQRRKIIQSLDEVDVRSVLQQLPDKSCPLASAAIVDAVEALGGKEHPSLAHEILSLVIQSVAGSQRRATHETVKRLELIQALIEAGLSGRLGPTQSNGGLVGPNLQPEAAVSTLRRWTNLAGHEAKVAAGLEDAAERIVEYVTARSAQSDERFRHTPFGGALILIAVLVRSGWWDAWHRELAAEEDSDADRLAAALALAVVARALDPRFCRAIEMDPALQAAFYPSGSPGTFLSKAEKRRIAEVLAKAKPTRPLCRSVAGLGKRLRLCSSALLDTFSASVPGCEGSTPAYLRQNLLTLDASVSEDGGTARLRRPPLDVLLILSGLKRATLKLPHGRTLILRPDWDP